MSAACQQCRAADVRDGGTRDRHAARVSETDGELRFPVHRSQVRGTSIARALRTWGTALGVVLPVSMVVALAVAFASAHAPPQPLILLLMGTTWLGPAARMIARLVDRGRRFAELRVEGDELVLTRADGIERRIARSALSQAYESYDAEAGVSAVTLTLGSGEEITLALANDGLVPRAPAVLAALKLDPGRRATVFRWRRTFEVLLGGVAGIALLVGLFLAMPSTPMMAITCPIFAGLPWLVGTLLGSAVGERSITIGAESIVARGRIRTTMARFADLKDVERIDRGLVLKFVDGHTETILLDPDDLKIAQDVQTQLREARARAARSPETARLAALLTEAGDTFESLRDTAAKVLTAATGFRDGAVSPAEVQAVLDDPNATATQRIAAAIALANAPGDEAPAQRERIRVAASGVASPRLRVALDAAAEGTLSEDALREAEEEEVEASGKSRSR